MEIFQFQCNVLIETLDLVEHCLVWLCLELLKPIYSY